VPHIHPKIRDDWFVEAFGELYPTLYAHRSTEAAEPEAAFAAAQLNLQPEDDVLDLCCGDGRHMTHLAGTGGSLTGLDYSADLLRLAQARPGLGGRLVRADMRALPFTNAFDAIVNFFTSFGYFQTPEENQRVVQDFARALKPGGRFFIDYMNATYVAANLVPHSERRAGHYDVCEKRWLDTVRRRVNKQTVVFKGGAKVTVLEESVRLYEPDEFAALLETGGLEAGRMFGDYDGNPLDDARPRMIVVGRKA